ncbi:MAG: hypothetical protein OXF02_01925 [Simkaniaceae bacterium]|nr:hypothetical protein [Simkaniaceae bacterium]
MAELVFHTGYGSYSHTLPHGSGDRGGVVRPDTITRQSSAPPAEGRADTHRARAQTALHPGEHVEVHKEHLQTGTPVDDDADEESLSDVRAKGYLSVLSALVTRAVIGNPADPAEMHRKSGQRREDPAEMHKLTRGTDWQPKESESESESGPEEVHEVALDTLRSSHLATV